MYTSLMRHNPEAELWILCMDEYTRKILELLNLKKARLISLGEFEDKELQQVKKERTQVEYCWTCTPSLPLYILKKSPSCKLVVYLDADLFFYSSITPIFQEFNDKSIFVVEHRFPKDQEKRIYSSGRFNVGVLVFRRDNEALNCLNRWRKQCLAWCFWREEEGKMGDQVYLNEWSRLYKDLVISKNLGVNAAPWNINQYRAWESGNGIFINSDKLICYHFHQFKILGRNKFSLSRGYKLSPDVKKYIYKPYIQEIKRQFHQVLFLDSNFNAFDKPVKMQFSKFISDISEIFSNKLKALVK